MMQSGPRIRYCVDETSDLQRIENFNLIHRIRDLVPCLTVWGFALLLDVVVFKSIHGFMYALLHYSCLFERSASTGRI